MPDIFISYAHEDMERVRPIVKELEKRWSVFWDRKIPPGKTWENSIGKALEESPCVLVVWSHSSVQSDWVKEEADVARKRDTLVPLFLDMVEPPMGFRRIHAADLSDWKNNKAHQGFQLLLGAIESKISPSTLPVTDSLPVPKPSRFHLAGAAGAAKTSPQRKPELQPVGIVSWVQKNQLVIAVAVVMLIILGVVWSTKQPSSNVENKSGSPSTEIVKVNQEADVRRKAEAARLTAEKDAATRREAEAAKARQDAEVLRKAEDARLTVAKDAARREAKAKETQIADARLEAKPSKFIDPLSVEFIDPQSAATVLKIGDEYGGGKIAWLDATGQHGLIAAKADLSGGEIYNWEAAKKACRELVNNGYSDWHLPTKEELNKLYHTKSDVGGFADYYYWSSTEYGADYEWVQYFSDGGLGWSIRTLAYRVRAVRAF